MSYLLGLDIGSSSVKASLIEADTGKVVGFCCFTGNGAWDINAVS